MDWRLPAVLALLLVAAPVSGAGSLASEPVVEESDTTSYLALDGPTERASFATASLDVAGALAVDNAAVQSDYTRLRFEHRYRAAETDEERRAAVRSAAAHIEARADRLERRERAALAEYNQGQISTRTYLRDLAVVDSGADRLGAAVTRLGVHADSAEGEPVSDRRVAQLKADLVPLSGPVTSRTGRALAGQNAPQRIYVETSGDGVVLAAVLAGSDDVGEAEKYVREAYVPGARNASAPNQFAENGTSDAASELDAAEERARELYPWAYEHHQGHSVGQLDPVLRLAAVYPVTVNHPHGTVRQGDLVAYVDGGTTDVYREIQYKSVSNLPVRRLGREQSEGLALSVNVTRPGGPMSVRTTDGGTPVEATLYVDGEHLGTTGGDGHRWLVAPGDDVNVTVAHDDRRVTISGTP